MPIRVTLDQLAAGLWQAAIVRGRFGVICTDLEPRDALESAVRAWRIAREIRRERSRKLN